MKGRIPTFCPFCEESAFWYQSEGATICGNWICVVTHIGEIGSPRRGILTEEQIDKLQTTGTID